MSHRSVPPDFFDGLYARDPDPWRFQTSAYEQAKYAATLAAIGGARIGRALEIGCSIGVLTQALGRQCDELVAVDVAEAALAAARARCAAQKQIRFARMDVPAEFPQGGFDLVLLSEVLYFLTAEGLDALGARIVPALRPGGRVLLVNWLGATGTALPGDAAAARFLAAVAPPLSPILQRREERWRLDLLAAP